MKILSIHIQNFRGIVDLNLNFDGKSAVIVGPNGVGKSAVVDAVDFLLRGEISRLQGEGTGDVSTTKHGPHVGCSSSESCVTASIQSINGKIFTVKRIVAQKDLVIIDPEYSSEFEEMVTYAQNGAHCLTRRELLRYILTTPTTRAEQIQTLLNISDTKNIRDALQKFKKNAAKIYKESSDSYARYTRELHTMVGATNDDQLREKINEFRLVLGGKELDSIETGLFTEDLTYSDSKEKEEISNLIRNIDDLISYIPTLLATLGNKFQSITNIISKIEAEDTSVANAFSIELIKSGLALMDGSGRCPLCLHKWPSDEDLKNVLNKRKEKSEKLSKLLDNFNVSVSELSSYFKEYQLKLKHLIQQLKEREGENECVTLLYTELRSLEDVIIPTNCTYDNFPNYETHLKEYIYKKDVKTLIKSLKEKVENLKPFIDADSKKKSDAWQVLNSAREIFKKLQKLKSENPLLKNVSDKANYLMETYDNTQARILNELFDSISDRFTEFYKLMHEEDEEAFTATLKKDGSSVNMTVDFYGKGQFPPMAYHSEGHQDSMGIALFFALMEKLTTSEFGLVVLDDVVMSVDIEHRRNFCKLLLTNFPERQFIITTHDTVWAKYLVNEGVVERKNYIEFLYWNVENGPVIEIGNDVWEKARIMSKTNLNGASAFLRREMECYFENICDKLHARIRYNNLHKWDYGQYMNAAYTELKGLIKMAKKHAEKLNIKQNIDKLNQIEQDLLNHLKAVNAENWVTNMLIHYNPNYQIATAEFLAAVDAMKAFCQCFECANCHSPISVVYDQLNPTIITCKCGNIMYQL